MIDHHAGCVRPGDDVVEWQQDRLAIEVVRGDLVGCTEKVIGRYNNHSRLFIERDDSQ